VAYCLGEPVYCSHIAVLFTDVKEAYNLDRVRVRILIDLQSLQLGNFELNWTVKMIREFRLSRFKNRLLKIISVVSRYKVLSFPQCTSLVTHLDVVSFRNSSITRWLWSFEPNFYILRKIFRIY